MNIVVLMGGLSAERDVSLASGKAVAEALRARGHGVTLVDISGAPDDRWAAFETALDRPDLTGAEVVFLALHGDEGEDGTIQALLELRGLCYTGSGVLGSALAMDKEMSKKVFDLGGIPTPEWTMVPSAADEGEVRRALDRVGGLPAVVKPVDQGSTVGVSIVRDARSVDEAISGAAAFSERVLIERYIPGREVTVSILGDEALPLVEIVPEGGFYDYECKYTKGKSRYICPAEIPEDRTRRIQDLGLKAFGLLGCAGFGRVDLRLAEDGSPFFLEINTIPGMTGTSLVPMAAKAVGIEFPDLVERICRLAMAGRARRGGRPCRESQAHP